MGAFPYGKDKAKNTNPIFLNKIRQLRRKLPSDFDHYFSLLEAHNYSNIPHSGCHGDLTFENILIAENIYVIDLLDSFFNSWVMDIAKLLMDIEIRWSFRKTRISNSLGIKLDYIKESIKEKACTGHNDCSISDIHHLMLLSAMRILPYARDYETYTSLCRKLREIEKLIQED